MLISLKQQASHKLLPKVVTHISLLENLILAMSYSGLYDKGDHIDTGIGGTRKVASSGKPSTGTFSSIPIIDLTNATSPSLDARKQVAREVYDACVNVGFFYIKNHGVPDEAIASVKQEAKRFFHEQSEEDKMELDITKNAEFYGYAPIKPKLGNGRSKTRESDAWNEIDVFRGLP